jgi:hypothetical protein
MVGKKYFSVNRGWLFAMFIALSMLVGCSEARRIGNGFRILRFHENQKVYLQRFGRSDNYLEGTIEVAGWNDTHIYAYVVKNYRGDIDGWYCVDIETGEIAGPMQPSMVEQEAKRNGIVIRPVDEILERF